jgi:hypothetical protein
MSEHDIIMAVLTPAAALIGAAIGFPLGIWICGKILK